MNDDLIKQIDEERYAYRLYGFDGSSTDLVLADCKAEIERLSKPYVPMTEKKFDDLYMEFLAMSAGETWAEYCQARFVQRYNEQRGVK